MIDRIDISYKASSIRKLLNEDEYSYIDVLGLINNIKDLTVVYYPFSENISGMCIKKENANTIAINSNTTIGRQRFSAAHELYHLYYDDNNISVSSDIQIENNDIEQKANCFASYFLLPYNTLKNELENKQIDINTIIELENKYGMSHQAMLYRLKLDDFIDNKLEKKLQIRNIKNKAIELGYSGKIYEKLSIEKQKQTFGNYIKQVNELYKKDKISHGKYNELLLKAFREDMVYKQINDEETNV